MQLEELYVMCVKTQGEIDRNLLNWAETVSHLLLEDLQTAGVLQTTDRHSFQDSVAISVLA